MSRILQILSIIALVNVFVPALLFFMGSLDKPTMNTWMLAATLAWFAAAPLARRVNAQ